ncbi:MAG: NAD-dependent epimerase/dehydratase family protein [Aigarchaeota archaeon]|nr:NAD-dependent epimerase/dehydratase family protein [Aigarchaeota archaeon]MDW8093047.1 NAD-dependent epimerase/dehydratase family protein [Nitrososphaerota archaeon]
MKWSGKRIIVTGGAGFIGGALVDRLLGLGGEVTVVDKLFIPNKHWVWQAKLERLNEIYKKHGYGEPSLVIMDLRTDRHAFQNLAKDYDIVFHLSALFGGREFVDRYQVETSEIFAIDHNVIMASYEAGVDRLHYSSSACVYAPSLNKPGYLLKEDDILSTGEGWNSSDNLYGFAKLMGELQLRALYLEKGFKSSVCRYLTVYGPGQFDASHAIAALIERALNREDPFVVWGSGEQERGFTYVEDIVEGTILATEKVTDATPINLGWDKRYKIKDVASMILNLSGHKPSKVFFDRNKPEGPLSRALDISRAKAMLGWEPKVDLEEGLKLTIDWHLKLRKIAAFRAS